jgi:hypothetical protein
MAPLPVILLSIDSLTHRHLPLRSVGRISLGLGARTAPCGPGCIYRGATAGGSQARDLPDVALSAQSAFGMREASDKLIRMARDVARDAACLWRVTVCGGK